MLAVTWGTRHFRCYLYGKRYLLRTDHAALKYMHNFAGNNIRLLRWSLRLSEFDFTVEHRPGIQIRHADALSRAVQAVAHDLELPADVVQTAQEGDKFCQSLKLGPLSSKSEYFIDREVLIFRRRKNGEHQFVVPLSLTQKVIKMNHDPMTVDNPRMGRTLDILCFRFYWPGMRRHVEEYVKNCHACQRLKPRHEFKAPLGDVMEPTRPWEIVAIDICGPFLTTPNKIRYLLTFLDHLTKYAESAPITSMTAED